MKNNIVQKPETQSMKNRDKILVAEKLTYQINRDIDVHSAAKSLVDALEKNSTESVGLKLPKEIFGVNVTWK